MSKWRAVYESPDGIKVEERPVVIIAFLDRGVEMTPASQDGILLVFNSHQDARWTADELEPGGLNSTCAVTRERASEWADLHNLKFSETA